jgi:hypothetical protein
MPPAGHFPTGADRPVDATRDTTIGADPCAPGADVGILDGVIAARYYFYYGTGSPAAVGRA